MIHREHPNYYWIRAAEEMERGDHTPDTAVAAVHYEMAYRYGIFATEISKGARELTLVALLAEEKVA